MSALRRNISAAMFGTVAFIVMLAVGVQILPAAPFLRYEPSGVMILAATVLLGPVGGLFASLVNNMLFLMTGAGNVFGVSANFINTSVYALTTGLIIRRVCTPRGHLAAYTAGTIAGTLVMIPANLVILSLQFGMTTETIMELMLPAILPFNILKGALNSLLFHLVGRSLIKVIKRSRIGVAY